MNKFIFIILFALAFQVNADDMRPVSLNIVATSTTEFVATLKIPIRNGVKQDLSLSLGDDAKLLNPPVRQVEGNAYFERSKFQRDLGLVNLEITIDGLVGVSGDVLVRIVDHNEQTNTTILNTQKPSMTVEALNTLTPFNTAVTYIIQGFEHILIGIDHLLFVLCLVYISNSRRKLFWTITGFTIAHSITLFLSATGLVTIPIRPVEAVIALSIVFLAWEIAKNKNNSLSKRYPVLVSSSFGLLHGFGFAAVLAEIGLPPSESALALFSFNVGVEIGQLFFVLVLFVVYKLSTLIFSTLKVSHLRLPVSYACGVIACVWMYERLATFVV